MGRTTVDLCEYDPAWPHRYESARRELEDVLGDLVVATHHIGSTSVPGLVAKPTIDIALVVSSIGEFVASVHAVERLGYEHRPASIFNDDHLFLRRIEGDERTHHLHVVSTSCTDLEDWLDFRDLLRGDPDAARQYAELKREMADRHHTDRGAYVDAKTQIIGQLLAEARASSG
jgi:GrpB-like predicted nucleotidyltransferase (UPF0157 family)